MRLHSPALSQLFAGKVEGSSRNVEKRANCRPMTFLRRVVAAMTQVITEKLVGMRL